MGTTWKMNARDKVRAAARRFWDSLDADARWQLGDDLVLGAWNWQDWMERKPLPGFTTELDRLRIWWEETR